MIQFIIRRLISSIPVLLGIILLVFVLVRVIPAIRAPRPTARRRPSVVRPVRRSAMAWINRSGSSSSSTWGHCSRATSAIPSGSGRPVSEILTERLPVTIELTILALLFAAIFGSSSVSSPRPGANSPSGRRDDGLRQPWGLDARLRPWSVPGLHLRRAAQDTRRSPSPHRDGSHRVSASRRWPSPGSPGLVGLHGQSSTSSRTCTCINSLLTAQWTNWRTHHGISSCAIAGRHDPARIIARMNRSSLLEVLELRSSRQHRPEKGPSESRMPSSAGAHAHPMADGRSGPFLEALSSASVPHVLSS